jgi:hypothetical protein
MGLVEIFLGEDLSDVSAGDILSAGILLGGIIALVLIFGWKILKYFSHI